MISLLVYFCSILHTAILCNDIIACLFLQHTSLCHPLQWYHCLFVFTAYFTHLTKWKQKRHIKRLSSVKAEEIRLKISTDDTTNDRHVHFYRFGQFFDQNCSTSFKLRSTLLPFLFTFVVYVLLYTISIQNLNKNILKNAALYNTTLGNTNSYFLL